MNQIAINRIQKNIPEILSAIQSGKKISVTFRGHEVATLIPSENKMESARKKLNQLRKTAVVGDILSPLEDEWEAME